MSVPTKNVMVASCACGGVELEASGAPITSVVCYCDDCQEGSGQIEALPNARPVRDSDGGTAYIAYRKDRVKSSKGARLLKGYKIREKSVTNRVVATCCNSAMFLSFDDAKHWVDVYSSRFKGDIPPVQMRVCAKFRPDTGHVPGDAPLYSGYPLKLLAKLVAAKIAMLVHR
jgi:hypothetical protein